MYIVYDLNSAQPSKNDGNGDIVIAASFSLFGPREEAGAGSSGEKRERETASSDSCAPPEHHFLGSVGSVVTVGEQGRTAWMPG